MLTIKAEVRPSLIHGLGVFALERIEPPRVVWEFVKDLDRKIAVSDLEKLSEAHRGFFEQHSNRDLTGAYVMICMDEARYINHSANPNTSPVLENGFQLQLIANQVIEIGDEITEDYYAIERNGLDMNNGRYVWDTI